MILAVREEVGIGVGIGEKRREKKQSGILLYCMRKVQHER